MIVSSRVEAVSRSAKSLELICDFQNAFGDSLMACQDLYSGVHVYFMGFERC
jgi:hypothetical protein